MDKKNTMLLTVIAVATLLVAIVGATFAYFSVTGSNTSTTTTANVTTARAGSVSLTQGISNMYLDITSAQMAQSNYGTDYYAMATETTAATTAQEHVLATVAAAGGETNSTYYCTVGYSIQVTQIANSSNSAYAALESEDAAFVITVVPETSSNNTATLFAGSRSLTTLKTQETGTSTITIHGNTNLILKGDVILHNLNKSQNDLAELGANISFNITSFSCDTAA